MDSVAHGSRQLGGAPDRRPYGSYAAIMAAFGGVLAATTSAERALRREPSAFSAFEFVLLCAGSFKAARTISRERVGSVLRQPFVETDGLVENADAVEEVPAGDGLRQAVGELVTCTRCAGTWAAASLLACQTIAPRFGRLLTWTLAAGAANDFLQAGFTILCARDTPAAHAGDAPEPNRNPPT